MPSLPSRGTPLRLDGDELDEDAIAALFSARGRDLAAVFAAADELRHEVSGDTVSYVVTRNINYTNVCYFRCGFCAFSKGKLAANLRGAPYVVPLEEIVRRCREAWDRGAVEVCLQGGIHPGFTGEYYLDVVRAIKSELPDLHVHAFSALEVWQGAATLGLPLEVYLDLLKAGAGVPPGDGRGDPRRRGAACHLSGQGQHRAVARGARRRPQSGPPLHDDDHVRLGREPEELGAAPRAATGAAAADGRIH